MSEPPWPPLRECIPNFSAGRDRGTVDMLCDTVSAAGVALLDIHVDVHYNRCVLTFADGFERLAAAALGLVEAAARIIDMTQHSGAHPRLGAADVFPFVPLHDEDVQACIGDVRMLAQRMGEELGICVYLYGQSALRPDRRRLSNVRRGEFEAWHAGIGKDPRWEPDFGPARPSRGGPVVLGTRPVLIAINFVLAAPDAALARRIARAVRGRSGLPGIQARGFSIGSQVHVSCNILDWRQTGPRRLFDRINDLATQAGNSVFHTEVVGLIPGAALAEGDAEAMRIVDWSGRRILENRLATVRPPTTTEHCV
ncbi:MAG: glutamate formimidoyltransferase [Caldilineaceae bacterium]|nr:glutamate formimidoyltransferase [Caldilineaceae bacterium]